jgi:hypothetical protein
MTSKMILFLKSKYSCLKFITCKLSLNRMSIEEVFRDKGTKALKVRIIEEGEQYSYAKRGGGQAIGKNYGVSDGATVAKLCCFEQQHFPRIKV